LVEPHQLVSAGRRWYLVAWDVRRDDWRTFRLDRLADARLAGGRCAARELPGGDAAAFVARSIRTMPQASSALLELAASAESVRATFRRDDLDVTVLDDARCRVRIDGSGDDALLRAVTWLASRHPVTVVEPESLAARARDLVANLSG
jgi:predicted DNA-binding transcriptional regulator YafY